MTGWVSRINLPQIRYSNGSFLHINSCIYGDYFGNLLSFTLEICAGSLLHPWLLSSINLIRAQIHFFFVFLHTMLPSWSDSVNKAERLFCHTVRKCFPGFLNIKLCLLSLYLVYLSLYIYFSKYCSYICSKSACWAIMSISWDLLCRNPVGARGVRFFLIKVVAVSPLMLCCLDRTILWSLFWYIFIIYSSNKCIVLFSLFCCFFIFIKWVKISGSDIISYQILNTLILLSYILSFHKFERKHVMEAK